MSICRVTASVSVLRTTLMSVWVILQSVLTARSVRHTYLDLSVVHSLTGKWICTPFLSFKTFTLPSHFTSISPHAPLITQIIWHSLLLRTAGHNFLLTCFVRCKCNSTQTRISYRCVNFIVDICERNQHCPTGFECINNYCHRITSSECDPPFSNSNGTSHTTV